MSGKIQSDFLVADSNYFNTQYYWKAAGTPDELLKALESQSGFEDGGRIYYVRSFDNDWNLLEGFSVEASMTSYSIHTDGNPRADVYGIETFIRSNLEVMEGELDPEKFETGNYVVQGVFDHESSEFQIGDSIKLNYYNERTGAYETKEYTLLAKVIADSHHEYRDTGECICPSCAADHFTASRKQTTANGLKCYFLQTKKEKRSCL